jgi:hypothetical protein
MVAKTRAPCHSYTAGFERTGDQRLNDLLADLSAYPGRSRARVVRFRAGARGSGALSTILANKRFRSREVSFQQSATVYPDAGLLFSGLTRVLVADSTEHS